MKFKKQLHVQHYGLFFCFLFSGLSLSAKDSETLVALQNATRTLSQAVDLHLTDAANPLVNSTVDITSEEAWLFFDNMKPSKVLSNYKNAIKINGAVIAPFNNCRLVVYKQGAVVIPHASTYQPLETFTATDFGGSSQKYTIDQYYTNAPITDIPAARRAALTDDNNIRSFKLKRGYMATFANEPDGMGYSRIFIADAADLEINLPIELSGKISFIRVFQWEWVSKKGWCGGTWNEPALFTKNLAHGDTQSDFINATWYYHWGATVGGSDNATATTLLNQEFVPEKWGAGGDVSAFYSNTRWSHLLGANEPDHSEQSNMSVATAIEEWPILMKTGARLGSPATTDYSWLYSFMNECAVRNYRVDYVVVHAYWGGKSPSSWYSDLKKIHDTTGRPLWIKEWNNGANWTTESWPSGSKGDHPYNDANAKKQLSDLKGILQVLDTASFIERYSIYNWVEDARQLITKNGDLTLAGEYLASTTPSLAFNSNKEVIPVWRMNVPKLAYSYSEANGKIRLTWTDPNGELTEKYVIEQSLDGANWSELEEISYATEYLTDVLSPDEIPHGEVYYRIKTIGCEGTIKTSNSIKYDVLKTEKDAALTLSYLKAKDDWSMYLFENPMNENAVITLGTPTYRNRYPVSARTRNVNKNSLELELKTWKNYLTGDYPAAFSNPDTVPFIALPRGYSQFGNIKLLTDTLLNVGKVWRTVTFDTPFEVVPVIIATQLTANDETATAIRVRNITKIGFDVCRKYEEGKTNVFEDISYIAATPGSGLYDDTHRIEVGITSNAAGVSYSNPAKIQFETPCNYPAFFGFIQSNNDETAANLRLKTRNSDGVEVFKQKEQTANNANPAAEIIGYMVLEMDTPATGIHSIVTEKSHTPVYDAYSYTIRLSNHQIINRIEVYSVWGAKLISASGVSDLDVSALQPGMYIAKVNGNTSLKFIKQ
ncbi:MAG: hypothetical protein EZS26_001982 [Candidatus Ordinivivax streblomastigis]|uniref:Asl1-like glycosyl hydrolase catalytic domain-containing protein n=1 Tax=Candidatus Ordinivivax streblomastigis TaxID=2540710 RepID=A0A5M8P072_9BACT|nr:MAG: hypothetical protein EZS26_001982 [Candidatus Ordinivivax streblomastigis]